MFGCLLVLSGKRKSGKDYLADALLKEYSPSSLLLRLSGPLKKQYALENDLDYSRLLDSSTYKEDHRKEMIIWGEQKRSQDPKFFCDLAVQDAMIRSQSLETGTKSVWVVSDARRPSDVEYFVEGFGRNEVCLVRVETSVEIRAERGFKFEHGVDNADSECALDDFEDWDFVFCNDSRKEFEANFEKLTDLVNDRLSGRYRFCKRLSGL